MHPVAIFRFSPTEGPGHFAEWLDAHGLRRQVFPLDEGVPVPADPRAFAGIGMMGGPMSVNGGLAWTAPLCALVGEAIAAGVPVIGHCLGGQLMARALGAPVARAATPEIGWHEVSVCDAKARRDWFGARAAFTALQWHYDAFALPGCATRVLTNAFNAEQAFIVDDRHIAFQCHIEMTRALTESWLATGADELPLRSSPAMQCATDIRRGIDVHLAQLQSVAGYVYARWTQGLAR